MRDRPIYVSFICFFLICYNTWYLVNAFAFVHGALMQKQIEEIDLSQRILIAKYFATFAIPLLCGMFMWEGANWARVLYIGWGIVNYSMDMIYLPHDRMNVTMQVVFGVIALILLLPAPRGYFLLPRHHS